MVQLLVAAVDGFEMFAMQAVINLGLVAPLEMTGSDMTLQRVEGDLVLGDLGVGVEGLVASDLARVLGGWLGHLVLAWRA